MNLLHIAVFFYTLSFLCLLNMFWYAHKGNENRADAFGIAGSTIALFTTAIALFYLGGM